MRRIWKQMVRDRFLWVVGLTICTAGISYGIVPQIRNFIS